MAFKNLSDTKQLVLIWTIPGLAVIGSVLFLMPLSYLFYTAIVAVFLSFFVFKKYLHSGWLDWWRYLLITVLGYFIVMTIFSFSPRLSILDYQLWRQAVEVKEPKIKEVFATMSGGKGSHPVIDINYAYSVNGKTYHKKEIRVEERNRLIFDFRNRDAQLLDFENWAKHQIDDKDYRVFYNRNNPKESKFFLDTAWFNYANSGMFYFVLTILGACLISLLIRFAAYKLKIK